MPPPNSTSREFVDCLGRLSRLSIASACTLLCVCLAWHRGQASPPSYNFGFSTQFGSIRSFHDTNSCAIRLSPFRKIRYWPGYPTRYVKPCHIINPIPIFDRVRASKHEDWSAACPGVHLRSLKKSGSWDLEIRLRNSLIVLGLVAVVAVVRQLDLQARRRAAA